ncbi:unnamed protein product [Cuscuta epithymum]|uniref:NADH dehydrogenase subunit 1 n=1 Tax=Cuscuta epithymum TaxID=186058 RepID=A0AAV0EGX9_9ASTE|nr:unnamed protein product [Cuscuta epithymum]
MFLLGDCNLLVLRSVLFVLLMLLGL